MQSIVSKVSASIQTLEEANRDILLGKRRLDCLSCGPLQIELMTRDDSSRAKLPFNPDMLTTNRETQQMMEVLTSSAPHTHRVKSACKVGGRSHSISGGHQPHAGHHYNDLAPRQSRYGGAKGKNQIHIVSKTQRKLPFGF